MKFYISAFVILVSLLSLSCRRHALRRADPIVTDSTTTKSEETQIIPTTETVRNSDTLVTLDKTYNIRVTFNDEQFDNVGYINSLDIEDPKSAKAKFICFKLDHSPQGILADVALKVDNDYCVPNRILSQVAANNPARDKKSITSIVTYGSAAPFKAAVMIIRIDSCIFDDQMTKLVGLISLNANEAKTLANNHKRSLVENCNIYSEASTSEKSALQGKESVLATIRLKNQEINELKVNIASSQALIVKLQNEISALNTSKALTSNELFAKTEEFKELEAAKKLKEESISKLQPELLKTTTHHNNFASAAATALENYNYSEGKLKEKATSGQAPTFIKNAETKFSQKDASGQATELNKIVVV